MLVLIPIQRSRSSHVVQINPLSKIYISTSILSVYILFLFFSLNCFRRFPSKSLFGILFLYVVLRYIYLYIGFECRNGECERKRRCWRRSVGKFQPCSDVTCWFGWFNGEFSTSQPPPIWLSSLVYSSGPSFYLRLYIMHIFVNDQ